MRVFRKKADGSTNAKDPLAIFATGAAITIMVALMLSGVIASIKLLLRVVFG